jgi:chaperonin GroES
LTLKWWLWRPKTACPQRLNQKQCRTSNLGCPDGKLNDDGKRVPLEVKAGDLILFGKYTSQEITLDGEELLIMREDEVLAVMTGETKKKK